MSAGRGRAPLLLRLSVRLLSPDVRDEVLGDLVEHWNADVSARPRGRRVLWLARQPLEVMTSRLRYGSGARPGAGLGPFRRRALAFSWLDVKLGLRMVRKHPGISLVIVFALALGIPVSLAPHHAIDAFFDEPLPFDDGGRVVGIVGYGGESGRRFLRLGDYERIREGLTTFETIGAALTREVNVISDDGRSAGERGAFMTPSSFALTRVAPIMGRTLSAGDEVEGAPDVVVIGYDFWRSRLAGAPDVVGSTIRIAGVPTTVVGVMPGGFGMPSSEQLWLPMRYRSIDYADRLGPGVWAYARLADGVSLEQAQAELSVVGARLAAVEGREQVRLRAVPFSALEFGEMSGRASVFLNVAQALPIVFLLIACGNVGVLLLARTASRTGEVAVRTALGASRARIVGQLFVEALVLALAATGVGLLAVESILLGLEPRIPLPFWVDLGVDAELVTKALALAVFSAVLAGVLPALRATGRALHRTLQTAGAGGGALRFGPLASSLIVVEVALGVGALFAGGMAWHVVSPTPDEQTRAADEDRYLVASITVPRSIHVSGGEQEGLEAHRVRLATTQAELARRLGSEPGVRRWAFSDEPPGEEVHERLVRVDGDGLPADHPGLPGVATWVEPSFFEVLGVQPLHGRLFDAGDVRLDPAVDPTAVIVNMKFLERRGMAPSSVGRPIRFSNGPDEPPGPWMEIVGVVPNIEASTDRVFFDGTPVVYLPATPGTLDPMALVVDVGAEPAAFTPRLRAILAETDPTAILDYVHPLDQLPAEELTFVRAALGLLVGLSLIAILLSTAALYALMSLTVAQRTREIGIRVALGGSVGTIVRTVARRALGQLVLGVGLGSAFWVAIFSTLLGGESPGELEEALAVWPWVLLAAAGAVVAVGLAACLRPTLRGVRIRPTEALRAEG